MADPMADRLARMLGLLPYLTRAGGPVPVRQVAAHFGVSEAQIRRDIKALWLVGTPGMQYDDMLQFGNYDDADPYVDLRDARGLTRPLRLNYPEAVALTAALRALAPLVAGRAELSDPVASTLEKLRAATHTPTAPGAAKEPTPEPSEPDILDVRLPRPGDPAVAEAVTAALVGGRQLTIDYVDAADQVSQRTIDPGRLHLEGGAAYLLAWCHLAQAPRTFRMDRILAAQLRDDVAQRRMNDDGQMSVAASASGAGDRVIELVLAPAGRWLSEELPTQAATLAPDGTTRVQLRVANAEWLRRLLLAQARHVVALPLDVATDVAAAAQAALANYPGAVAD